MRILKPLRLGIFLFVFILGARSASAGWTDLDAKIAGLKSAVAAKSVRQCRHQWVIVRRLGNVCTRALDQLATPVEEAEAALREEEARVRVRACPTVIDYGCTADQIGYREATDLLEEARYELSLAIDEALAGRTAGPWWDRAFVKDNRLRVIWAEDFIEKALQAYEDSRALANALSSGE
jgi:hypothetical protein